MEVKFLFLRYIESLNIYEISNYINSQIFNILKV